MRSLDIVRRSSRSLLAARARTLLTAFAIAVGVFALTLTLGASNGAQDYADKIVKNNFDPSELIVTADNSLFDAADTSKPQVYDLNFGTVTNAAGAATQIKMLDQDDITTLRGVAGVESVRPLSSLSLQYVTRDGQKQYVGTAQGYSDYKSPELLAGSIPQKLANNTVILPEGFVTSLGFSSPQDAIGKTIRLAVKKQFDQSALLSSLAQGDQSALSGALTDTADSQETEFTVIAVTKKPLMLIQPGTELYLSISQDDLTKLSDYTTEGTANYHKYLSAYVKVADGTDTQKLAAAQATIKNKGYGAQSVVDTEKTITQVISVLQGIVTVFGMIAVVASVFGVVNTMYISVLQRTREIGLMKALGMHKRDINKLFLFEAGLIGLLGGIIGSLLAVGLGTLLNPFISEQLTLGDAHLLQFKLGQIVMLVVALVIVAIAAGLFPARKASRLDPIEALRTE